MKFTLHRAYEVDSLGVTGVAGYMENDAPDDSLFSCLTLDHKDVMLPAGTYGLIPGRMVTHKADRAQIVDAHGNPTDYFIHGVSKAIDSKGCVGVGDSRPTPGTLAGGLADHVADKIFAIVRDNPGSTLTILDIPVPFSASLNTLASGAA